MTHRKKICIHCKTKYYYQASGHGCDDELNDDKYCPECMGAIVDALKSIPVKFEEIDTDASDEVTYKELLAIRKKCTNMFIRIRMPLFDMSTGDYQNNIQIGDYWLSEWEKSPEYTITKSIRVHKGTKTPEDKNVVYTTPKTLLNPKKTYPEKREEPYFVGVQPMSAPVGLTYALKYNYKDQGELDG